MKRVWLTSVLGVALVCALLVGCSNDTPSKTTSAYNSDTSQLFAIPQDQMAHVQIVTVEPTTIQRVLRLTGTVAFNGFATTPVITQVGGPISRIVVSPGQSVRKGQPLLYVASPDYSQLRAAYMKAKDAYELAEKNYARADDLYNHHAIAARDLEAASSARNQAQADLQASEQALRILGFQDPNAPAPNALKAEIPLLAPIGGEVVERLVAPGQVIQAGATQAFTISNTSTVWVLANVYQQDLPYVRVGDPVTITTDAYPNQEFHGKISYVAAALDATTRTLQARIEVQNPQDRLKKDMYVVSGVLAGKIPNALVVPKSAVLRDSENEPFVYVLAGNNQFARRQVKLGEPSGDQMQITNGIAAGDKVAGDGSLFLQFANSLQK
jgi:cobalt-zinc-cadmium efflux system membrane fusion protein